MKKFFVLMVILCFALIVFTACEGINEAEQGKEQQVVEEKVEPTPIEKAIEDIKNGRHKYYYGDIRYYDVQTFGPDTVVTCRVIENPYSYVNDFSTFIQAHQKILRDKGRRILKTEMIFSASYGDLEAFLIFYEGTMEE